MDTDFHKIYNIHDNNGTGFSNPSETINISKNIWFGCHVTVLKGVEVGEGSVVAAGSTLRKKNFFEYVILGNDKILRENIRWDR